MKRAAWMLGIFLGGTVMTQAAGYDPKDAWQPPRVQSKVEAINRRVRAEIARGPYQASWESLKTHPVPDWFRDAKFGIFIHWGLYSVPAYNNEWYSRLMYQQGTDEFKHHVATFGPQDKFGYKDFIPLLTAAKYDPQHWADLFKKAGAKYVVPVAEHHDGFCMYDTVLSRWSAARMGPRRDLIGDLARAVRAEGLVFGLSTHRAEHWWFMNGGMKFPSDVQNPVCADFYGPAQGDGTAPDERFLNDWVARTAELVEKYHPQVMGDFDWWIGEQPAFDPHFRRILAYYYDQPYAQKEGVVLTAKEKTFVPGATVGDVEKGQRAGIQILPWQTDTSISWRSWAYLTNDQLKDAPYLVRTLINTVSKNGNLLLNVGPRPDGTIPEEEEKILLQIGGWLGVNGEGIYGTRPWVASGEGPTVEKGGAFQESDATYRQGDVRYTVKGNALYVFSMVAPRGKLALRLLGRQASPGLEVLSVTSLQDGSPVEWKRDDQALTFRGLRALGTLPTAYKVTLSGTKLGRLRTEADGGAVTVSAELRNYDDLPVTVRTALRVNGEAATLSAPGTVPGGSAIEVQRVFAPGTPGVYALGLSDERENVPPVAVTLPAMDLSGVWAFHKGDDPGWKKPALSDEDWEKVTLPDAWEHHSNYTNDNVYGWYRLRVTVPAEWRGHDLALPLGKIDDCDISYFNGKEVGRTGAFPPSFQGAWNVERRYVVPAKWVRFGAENVIAIRVFDATGGGGLYAGPLGPVEAVAKP